MVEIFSGVFQAGAGVAAGYHQRQPSTSVFTDGGSVFVQLVYNSIQVC